MAAAAGITADRSFASPQNVSQLRYAYQDPRSPGQKVIEARLILDNIFSYCSPGTIFRLAKSCRTAKRAADAYTRLAYDISRFLSPYFSPDCMRALRNFQATHGALIVGPSAYHFLNRSPDPGHELHIACRWGEATEIKQLLVSDGYISRGDAEWCYGCHFNKFTEDRELIARITLVQGHCPIWSMMKLQGDSSCMMNVITHSTAYCLFPRATFETGLTRSMGSISCTDSGSELPDELSIPLPEATPDTCPELFTPGYRSFSDSMAWRLPLDCKGLLVATSPHPDTEAIITDRLLGHSFSIPPSGACRKEIKLVTPRLEHVYSVGSERFHAAAEQFLTRLVLADPHRSGAVFDYEYVEFVRQCFIGRRTTDEISYQKVLWPTMKQMAPIPHETQTRAPLHCTACSTVQQYWWKSPGSPCLLHFPQGSPPSYKPITPRLHFQRPWPIPLDLLVQLEELDDDFEDA